MITNRILLIGDFVVMVLFPGACFGESNSVTSAQLEEGFMTPPDSIQTSA